MLSVRSLGRWAMCLILHHLLGGGLADSACEHPGQLSEHRNATCGVGLLQAGSRVTQRDFGCSSGNVRRRRRAKDMCSCRRRSGREDLESGWACVGDVIAAADEEEPAPACPLADVRRRRRDSACSCRRRDSSADLPTGWSCIGDAIAATSPSPPASSPSPGGETTSPLPGRTTLSAGQPPTLPPAVVDGSALSFLVIGDAGTRSSRQREVAASLAQVASSLQPAFIAHIGDNIYGDGAEGDPQLIVDWWRDIYISYDALKRPWYVVTGNHDWHTDARVERDFSDHELNVGGWWMMPHFWYRRSFQLHSVARLDVFFIDTSIWKGSSLAEEYFGEGVQREQVAWLQAELASSTADWKVVIGHHPVYSAGSHGTTEDLLYELDPLLREFGVNFYFNGHDHNKQLISHRGMHYVTSGAGGKSSSSRSGEEPAGSLRYIFQDSGFVGLSIGDASTAALTFYSETGEPQAVQVISNVPPGPADPSLLQRASTQPHCHGKVLKDVDRTCSLDGCKVVADQLTTRTCRDYCGANGLRCVDGWEEEDEDCVESAQLGCDKSRASTSNHICQCM